MQLSYERSWGSRSPFTGVRRVVGAVIVGFAVAAALSGDFDVANHAARDKCAGSTSVCIAAGDFAGGFAVAAIIVAALVPLGFWLARIRRRYLPAGMLLPFVVEPLSGVNLVGTVHPVIRYLMAAAIAFGLLGLVAHGLDSSRGGDIGEGCRSQQEVSERPGNGRQQPTVGDS
jgi:hypothetical protein